MTSAIQGSAQETSVNPYTQRLKITELFLSIQGEADAVGWPTIFVRLTGCPLRCVYCDTEYAFHGGQWFSIADLLTKIAEYQIPRVCVTGGEPLAQKNCFALLTALCDAGYQVSLETSGALDISAVDTRVARVVDIKTPGSGESKRNDLHNLSYLTSHDQLKFVLCDRADYEWSRAFITEHQLTTRCMVLLSASHQQLSATELAEWILQDRLAVRLQVQLHKLLWDNTPGH